MGFLGSPVKNSALLKSIELNSAAPHLPFQEFYHFTNTAQVQECIPLSTGIITFSGMRMETNSFLPQLHCITNLWVQELEDQISLPTQLLWTYANVKNSSFHPTVYKFLFPPFNFQGHAVLVCFFFPLYILNFTHPIPTTLRLQP